MEVVRILSPLDLPKFEKNISLTIGEFDGIHLAHQKLFNQTLNFASKDNTLSVVLTFDPHPDQLLKEDIFFESIFSFEEKIKEIGKYNFDYLLIVNFTKELSNMTHQEFYLKYLKPLHIKNLIVGFDFKYGHKGLGNYQTIKEAGIENVIINEQMLYNNQTISSTLIKKLLNEGKIEEVNYLLGKKFKISGTVIYGKQIGSKINVPTANIRLDNNYPTLKKGVYVVKCLIDNNKYAGIMNIGHNPSFNYNQNRSYEVHIIEDGFNMNLYDKHIVVELIKFIRSEEVFENINAFKKQIELDKKEAILVLNNRL